MVRRCLFGRRMGKVVCVKLPLEMFVWVRRNRVNCGVVLRDWIRDEMRKEGGGL